MPQTTISKSNGKTDRRSQIVEIARQQFRETGLADTTLDQISEQAGIARPNLYRYFKNKTELVSAVLVEEAWAINRFRQSKTKGKKKFSEKVVRSIVATVEVLSTDRLWAEIVSPANVPYTAYIASSDPEVLQSNYDYWMPILEQAEASGEMKSGLNPEEVMKWLLGIEFMFMERREIFSDLKEVERYARKFVLPALTAD